MRSSEASGWSNARHSTPNIFQQKWIGDVAFVKYAPSLFFVVFLSCHFASAPNYLRHNNYPFHFMFQEVLEADEEIGKLVCGHNYHVHCIKQWLSRKNSCPVCKTVISKT
jgi:hypothetical protein